MTALDGSAMPTRKEHNRADRSGEQRGMKLGVNDIAVVGPCWRGVLDALSYHLGPKDATRANVVGRICGGLGEIRRSPRLAGTN